MSEANPERGEHEIVLAGVTYRLRPSHAAINAIERRTERSTIELYQAGNRGALTLVQLGQIVGALIRAGADDDLTKRVNDDRIAELIFEEGIYGAMARVTLCLVDAASGGRTASGEARAATPGTPAPGGAASKA